MHTAYLVLAHAQPRHFGRLVRAIAGDGDAVFAHVDRRVDIEPFQSAASGSDVRFLEKRIAVRRFDFSQVAATLALIEAAFAAPERYGRFVLLSGADFPVKPRTAIRKAFASDREFLRVDVRSGPRPFTLGRRRLLVPGLRGLVQTLLGLMPRRTYGGSPIYGGSQWWALTRPCVEFVLGFVRSHPDYIRFHRFAPVPDESFFHSIVKASPFAPAISQDYSGGTKPGPEDANVYGAHYIDWAAAREAGPKVLTTADLPALRTTPALFARKFMEPESDEVVAELEEIL